MSAFKRLRRLVGLIHCAFSDHPGYRRHPGFTRRHDDSVTYSCNICGESKTMEAHGEEHARFLKKHGSKIKG